MFTVPAKRCLGSEGREGPRGCDRVDERTRGVLTEMGQCSCLELRNFLLSLFYLVLRENAVWNLGRGVYYRCPLLFCGFRLSAYCEVYCKWNVTVAVSVFAYLLLV